MSRLSLVESVYETMSSCAAYLYAVGGIAGDGLSLLAIAFVFCALFAVALLRNRQANKTASRSSNRLVLRAMAFVACATVATVYVSTGLESPMHRYSGHYVHPDKDRPASIPDLYNATMRELQHGLEAGLYTSVDLVNVSRRETGLGRCTDCHLNRTGVCRSHQRSQSTATCSHRDRTHRGPTCRGEEVR